MTELVILSGKGGTGKTSVVASLAVLARNAVLADCDVDAPDLHLVLDPEVWRAHDFVSGHRCMVDEELCSLCGACAEACRFTAISCGNGGSAMVEPLACEGCGVCALGCPEQAIHMVPRQAGRWMMSRTRCGPLVHARLAVGGSSSGRLVSLVRQQARLLAEMERREVVLVDGPPGTGCPVIAALTGASMLLVVTEPTPAGEHDLERVLQLARHFKVPAAVCINRWDLHPPRTIAIENLARREGARLAGRVRYDPLVTTAQVKGLTVVELGGDAARDLQALWWRLGELWPALHQERPAAGPAHAAAGRARAISRRRSS